MTEPSEIEKRLDDAIAKAESMQYNSDVDMGEILEDLEEAKLLLGCLPSPERSNQNSETE